MKSFKEFLAERINEGDRVHLRAEGYWKSKSTATTEEWEHDDKPGIKIVLRSDGNNQLVVNGKVKETNKNIGKFLYLKESKKSEIKHFKWRGLNYTFNTRTKMIDGPVSVPYHVGHATPEMVKFLASNFPNEID